MSDVEGVIDVLNHAHSLERSVNSALAEDGLRADLWRILYMLFQSPGALMGELSASLAIPAASLTRLVDELSDEGLVFRRPTPGDRRKAGVYLSRMGSDRLVRSSAIVASRIPSGTSVPLSGRGREVGLEATT